MNLDDRLRAAADDVNRSTAQLMPPERRRSTLFWRTAAAIGTAGLVIVGTITLLQFQDPDGSGTTVPAASGPTSSAPADTTTTAVSPSSTASATTTAASSTTTSVAPTTTVPPAPDLPEPLAGWIHMPAADTSAIDGTVTDALTIADRTVAIGCSNSGPAAWYLDDEGSWMSATGLQGTSCLRAAASAPHGLYGSGPDGLFRSVDAGTSWEKVAFDEPGWPQLVVAVGDRVTLIHQRAALNESSVATLYTTIDGSTWTTGPADSAVLFDSSEAAATLPWDSGALIVGASPGGEFVPTAAVWVTEDALTWIKVTPGGTGFHRAWMRAVVQVSDGSYISVGGDDGDTNLMAAWVSIDGLTWTRSPAPDNDVPAEFGSMSAEAVTVIDGTIYAAGIDFDAARDDGALPAVWSSDDGLRWTRVPLDTAVARIPFTVAGDVGFWPPANWPDAGDTLILRRESGS